MDSYEFFNRFFTEHDDSISLSLERDPLGFQPIWTALGNAVFNGVTTSVASDIRNYTLNLIHQAVVFEIQHRHAYFWAELVKKTKREDGSQETSLAIHSRILLALELMLAYSAVAGEWDRESSTGILGISAARKRWEQTEKNNTIKLTCAPSNPNENNYKGFVTLLVRQSGLGLNGRYGGPFKNMNLLEKNGGFPGNTNIWQEILGRRLDNHYKDLVNSLVDSVVECMGNNFNLTLKPGASYIGLYKKAFMAREISPQIKRFWLAQMNIVPKSLAYALYQEINPQSDTPETEIQSVFHRHKEHPEAKQICEVEPFLVLLEYLFAAILQESSLEFQRKLVLFIQENIPSTPSSSIVSPRLVRLIEIAKKPISQMPSSLIEYHVEICNERLVHPWVVNNENTVFKKVNYIRNLEESVHALKQNGISGIRWRRDYYLNSIKEIKSGIGAI